ncbi:hypothetical protein FACS1894108_06780 [Planctomycetales bacterium]|nr:hypothetical protein FACS1894108_06780 [Planctomycetales bacterium]
MPRISITIREYEPLVCGEKDEKATADKPATLSDMSFKHLKNFIETAKLRGPLDKKETAATDIFRVGFAGGKDQIIARNYAGIVALKNGVTIEILPKIYDRNNSEKTEADKKKAVKSARDIMLNMLRTLRAAPFKYSQKANLKTERFNLLEIFIRMFIDEVFKLAKRGLQSGYVAVSANEKFLKGRLNFSQHLKHNSAHRERLYCDYDVFSVNRIENQIIKKTLIFLQDQTQRDRSQRDLAHLLNVYFDDVDVPKNIDRAFAQLSYPRNLQEYALVLQWCEVFLRRQSFTAFSGSKSAFALLFPMEKLFEDYIATKIRAGAPADYTVKTQDKTHHLFDTPKRFKLRPDIVLESGVKSPVIMDTKWKLLTNDEKNNHGISPADMYQMYAYHKKYGAARVCLLYPLNAKIAEVAARKNPIATYAENTGVTVEVWAIDLTPEKAENTGVTVEVWTIDLTPEKIDAEIERLLN